jgi:hypothetical protein
MIQIGAAASASKASRRQLPWLLGLLLLTCVLCGCAISPSTPSGMLPSGFDTVQRHEGSVRIQVSGGCEDCALGQAKISNAAFAEAVTKAVKASGVFSRVTQGSDADFLLSVRIFRSETPLMGFNMRADIEAGWTLTRGRSGEGIWRESINSEYTATMGDTVIGIQRVRFASEGAARTNIAEAIAKLSRLSIKRPIQTAGADSASQ